MADGGGRLGKELLDCQKDKSSGITVVSVGGSNKHLEGTINGPEGTPYEGGVYKVRHDMWHYKQKCCMVLTGLFSKEWVFKKLALVFTYKGMRTRSTS